MSILISQPPDMEVHVEDDQGSLRFSVVFAVDIGFLEAELDRLRWAHLCEARLTGQNHASPGTGYAQSSLMGPGKSVPADDRGRGLAAGHRNEESRLIVTGGSVADRQKQNPVGVLHLVMRAAAHSLGEIFSPDALRLTGSRDSCVPPRANASLWDDDSPALAQGSDGSRFGVTRPTRVACIVSRTAPATTWGPGRKLAGATLVVIENAEEKSTTDIAQELRSRAAAPGVSRTFNAGLSVPSANALSEVEKTWPTTSRHVSMPRSGALHHGMLARSATVADRMTGFQRSGRKAMVSREHKSEGLGADHGDRGLGFTRLPAGNGSFALAQRRALVGACQVPRADCLVAMQPGAPPSYLPEAPEARGATKGSRGRGRVRFAEGTFSGVDDGDYAGLWGVDEELDASIEVSDVSEADDLGPSCPLKVTIGRVSTWRSATRQVYRDRRRGSTSGVDAGQEAGGPVAVLQITVVGAAYVGASSTLEFAGALRRRLLSGEGDD